MPTLLERARALVAAGRWLPSGHGGAQMAARGIMNADVSYGIMDAVTVADYSDDREGPALLLLQYDRAGNPLHVVWGFKYNPDLIASVITAYYPSRDIWEPDFIRRKPG